MRNLIFMMLIACCFASSCIAASQNLTKAHFEIKSRLEIIENYLKDVNSDPALKRIEAINFLEDLTKIESESDGNDLGKLNPTKNDLQKWTNWYSINKSKIYWSVKDNKVHVRN